MPNRRRFVGFLCSLVASSLAGAVFAAGQRATSPPTSGGDASAVLAAAREALGGEKKLSAVKSFVATGRTRQVRGDNLVPIEFEIAVELPDKYMRRDEIPAQESGPTSSGFNGDGLIQVPAPALPPMPSPASSAASGGRPGGPAMPSPAAALEMMRKSRVNALKQDFVKLTLGLFAGSFPGAPVTFSLAGKAEAPQGTADVVDVKGAGTLALKFFISTQSHLPIMVSWTAPVAGKPVENRLYYSEYRDAGGGVQFPFRLRRATGTDTVEETNFDGFKINAKIDPRKFEVVK